MQTASSERRAFRRHDFESQHVVVERFDRNGMALAMGRLIDLSASGVRIRCISTELTPGTQLRVRLSLPTLGGIRPFVRGGEHLSPSNEWNGFLAVRRIVPVTPSMRLSTSDAPRPAGSVDIGGQLLDMDDVDRGMLRLYLSTHPIAA